MCKQGWLQNMECSYQHHPRTPQPYLLAGSAATRLHRYKYKTLLRMSEAFISSVPGAQDLRLLASSLGTLLYRSPPRYFQQPRVQSISKLGFPATPSHATTMLPHPHAHAHKLTSLPPPPKRTHTHTHNSGRTARLDYPRQHLVASNHGESVLASLWRPSKGQCPPASTIGAAVGWTSTSLPPLSSSGWR